jgi:ABC-type siderophore export system fused ATPase/permease subunit
MNYKDTLMPFIIAAKAILYEPKRAAQIMGMMATKTGAIDAVHAVIAGIEQKQPVPPAIAPILGVTILMMVVSLAKDITGKTVPPELLNQVVSELMKNVNDAHSQQTQQPPPQAAPQPQGIIQGAAA